MELQERLVDLQGLIRQNQGVFNVEQQAWREHGGRILHFQAKPAEIEEWYYAYDPMAAMHMISVDYARETEDINMLVDLHRELIDEDMVMGRGGLMLLASTIFKDAFEGEHEQPNHSFMHINDTYYRPAAELGYVEPCETMTGEGLMDLCFAYMEHGDIAIDVHDFQRLFVAAEMLRHSTVGLRQALSSGVLRVYENPDEEKIKDAMHAEREAGGIPIVGMLGVSEERYERFLNRQNVLSDGMLRYLEMHAGMDFSDVLPQAEADEIRMLALRAQMLYASSWMSDSFTGPDETREARAKDEFYAMTRTLQSLFGDIRNPVCGRLKTPAIKGPLHEVLWFMDAFVLRQAEPEKYRHIRTYPAYTRDDAPKVGYPEQKRGFDFTVLHDKAMDYVQLKSSPKRKNTAQESLDDQILEHLPEEARAFPFAGNDEYHPEIWVLHEPNFMEVNPKRLAAKLRTYAKWCESGFDEGMRDEVLKYVMQSVAWEYENIAGRSKDRSRQLRSSMSQYVMSLLSDGQPQPPKSNRAERRRLAKLERKHADKSKNYTRTRL